MNFYGLPVDTKEHLHIDLSVKPGELP